MHHLLWQQRRHQAANEVYEVALTNQLVMPCDRHGLGKVEMETEHGQVACLWGVGHALKGLPDEGIKVANWERTGMGKTEDGGEQLQSAWGVTSDWHPCHHHV
jgi:hypothetical protein